MRLDNLVYRLGLGRSRAMARQMVNHGNVLLNGKKVTIPSYQIKVGDVVGIRAGSKNKPLFATLDEKLKTVKIPSWLKINFDKKEVTVEGLPQAPQSELLFNVGAVLEFFSR